MPSRCRPSGVAAGSGQVRLFVLMHLTIAGFQLFDLTLFLVSEFGFRGP